MKKGGAKIKATLLLPSLLLPNERPPRIGIYRGIRRNVSGSVETLGPKFGRSSVRFCQISPTPPAYDNVTLAPRSGSLYYFQTITDKVLEHGLLQYPCRTGWKVMN